ncbi:MAG TPA: VTT domain-containing protein [Candidatus Paceibacterota bacterium]|nr:VTT domain-containing protein [Candidatus Paceibacterota bacterium]
MRHGHAAKQAGTPSMRYYENLMRVRPFLFHHLVTASVSLWLLPFIIIPSVIVLEELTIAVVGVAAADHHIPLLFGIVVLIIGIVIGDSISFAIGRLATRYRFARRIVEHERVAPLRLLLRERSGSTVFTTRFVPGFRFSMYMACGFFGVSYGRFLSASVAGAIVWATTLATLSFFFGFYTFHALGFWRWPILVGVVIIFVYVGHAHWRKVTAYTSAATND